MFRKLITYLYRKYGQPDIVGMTRIQMTGSAQSVEVLNLPPAERKQIAQEAKNLLESEVLKLAIGNVKTRLMNHIQLEAKTAEIIFYDRFSINGVALIEDELHSYAEINPDLDEDRDDENDNF